MALVNEDSGGTVRGSQVNFGAEVASDLLHSHDVTSRLSLDEVSYAQAEAQMNSGKAYAAIVIPPGFTASLLYAYGLSSASAGHADDPAADQPAGGIHRGAARHRRRAAGPATGIERGREQALLGGRQARQYPAQRGRHRQPHHGGDERFPLAPAGLGARAERLLHLTAGAHVRVPRRCSRQLQHRRRAGVRHQRDRPPMAAADAGRHQPVADAPGEMVGGAGRRADPDRHPAPGRGRAP